MKLPASINGFHVHFIGFLAFLMFAGVVSGASVDSGSESDGSEGSEESSLSVGSIDWQRYSREEIYGVLQNANAYSESALLCQELSIPHNDKFANLPLIYMNKNNLYLFVLFMEKFDYSKVNLAIFWNIVLHSIAGNLHYFEAILATQQELIFNNFRTFWYRLMSIDVITEMDEVGDEIVNRSKCKIVHPAVKFALQFFAKVAHPEDNSEQNPLKFASFCIFDLLFEDAYSPFPESFLAGILKISKIDLNSAREGNCVALHTLGRKRLPDYYYQMILTNPKLNVNCIVPATLRKHGHISCQVPPLPLFWHALIYQNYRGMSQLWANKNLDVLPLVPSFFQLLRLAILFFFFYCWDGKACKVERRIA